MMPEVAIHDYHLYVVDLCCHSPSMVIILMIVVILMKVVCSCSSGDALTMQPYHYDYYYYHDLVCSNNDDGSCNPWLSCSSNCWCHSPSMVIIYPQMIMILSILMIMICSYRIGFVLAMQTCHHEYYQYHDLDCTTMMLKAALPEYQVDLIDAAKVHPWWSSTLRWYW